MWTGAGSRLAFSLGSVASTGFTSAEGSTVPDDVPSAWDAFPHPDHSGGSDHSGLGIAASISGLAPTGRGASAGASSIVSRSTTGASFHSRSYSILACSMASSPLRPAMTRGSQSATSSPSPKPGNRMIRTRGRGSSRLKIRSRAAAYPSPGGSLSGKIATSFPARGVQSVLWGLSDPWDDVVAR